MDDNFFSLSVFSSILSRLFIDLSEIKLLINNYCIKEKADEKEDIFFQLFFPFLRSRGFFLSLALAISREKGKLLRSKRNPFIPDIFNRADIKNVYDTESRREVTAQVIQQARQYFLLSRPNRYLLCTCIYSRIPFLFFFVTLLFKSLNMKNLE